jgi:LuxR family maltose regulon positive regulatory protein
MQRQHPLAEPQDPLIAAKVTVPALRPGTVSRLGQRDLLTDRRPAIVVVSAPPGYGKTSLMVDWARRDLRKVAWVSLDRGDNNPAAFLATFAMAIQQLQPVDQAVFDDLATPGGSVLGRAVPRLARTVKSCVQPFLLLVDDLHEVDDQHYRDALNLIVDHLPPESTLVASSRRDVCLDLGRRRASGELLEIGPSQLAFSIDEAAELLAGADVNLGRDEAEVLVRRTEGWPLGLYLAALALRGGFATLQGRRLFSGDDVFVAEYLRSEILDRASPEVRRFLTRTAVLDQLCGPLCDQVLGSGGSANTLTSLQRSNLFLEPLDHHSEWYRYHGLFRDMLRAELHRDEPDLVPELNRNAADWYETHGRPADAIDHARTAGDTERAGRLVAECCQSAYDDGRVSTTLRWLAEVTSAEVERYPILAVDLAWAAVDTGQPVKAAHWADIADRSSFTGSPLKRSTSFEAYRAILRAAMCRHGVPGLLVDAEFAEAAEPQWGPHRCVALRALFEARVLAGDLDSAQRVLDEWIETAQEAKQALLTQALTERSLLAIDRGEWDSAAADLLNARALLTALGQNEYMQSGLTYAASARTAVQYRDLPEAREQLTRALRLRTLATWAYPRAAVKLRLELAKACLALADPTGARQQLREIDEIFQHRPELGTLNSEVDTLRRQLVTVAVGAAGISAITVAELRLLPYFQTRLTYQEIGQRLYVSTNTIKTEVKNLYRKLGVDSRHEAIERARQVGLLAR